MGLFYTKPKLLIKVLIRVVILSKFKYYSSYKANNNFLYLAFFLFLFLPEFLGINK